MNRTGHTFTRPLGSAIPARPRAARMTTATTGPAAARMAPVLMGVLLLGAAACAAPRARGGGSVDNSALLPRILPDGEVRMEGMSPAWVKSLIVVQMRIETATPEGTFQAATRALDHLAETGVNGLWVNPVYQRGDRGNGYGNFGVHTIEPLLTGSPTRAGSLEVARQFVAEAHRRRIRVFWDVVVWGTRKDAPLVARHPEFYLKHDGQFVEAWGGWAFDWGSPALRAWFTRAAANLIEETGADGFRVDVAPATSGYYFKEVRDALYAGGRKVVVIAELPCERNGTFDFEQVGVLDWAETPNWLGGHGDFLLRNNIVDAIRTGAGIGPKALAAQGRAGMERYYTQNLCCHDDAGPFVRGSRIRFAYCSILAPFIPMWWIGEEWDNPKQLGGPGNTGVMYFNTIDWAWRDGPGREFFEDAKRFIRIRRSHPEIFEQFPASHRDAGIAKVATHIAGAPNPLQAYGRHGAGRAVLVVPNPTTAAATVEVIPDYDALGVDRAARHRVTDLLRGTEMSEGGGPPARFSVPLPAGHLGVYLVEPAAAAGAGPRVSAGTRHEP